MLETIGGGAIIVALTLAITYGAIILVALFHPDPKRREHADSLLKHHRFTRKLPRHRR